MQFLRPIKFISTLEFLLYSNIWIALTAASLAMLFYPVFEISINYFVVVFVFSGTCFTYNFQRLLKLKTGQALMQPRKRWMETHQRLILLITLAAGVLTFGCFLMLNVRVIWILVPAGFASLFYVGKFLNPKQPGLRDLPYLKVYLVALVWAVLDGVLPPFNEGVAVSLRIWVFTGAVFLIILSLSIVFDLRDVNLDDRRTRTIPQLVGENWTRIIAGLLLSLGCFLLALLNGALVFPAIVTLIAGVVIIVFYHAKRSDYFYSFVVDGIILLPTLVYYLQRLLN